jgi:hypothetical protein
MAKKTSNDAGMNRQVSRMNDMNRELVELLRSESSALTGDDSGRSEELLNIHHRYNNIIQQDYQGIRSSKDPTDSTYDYIVNALLGGNKTYGNASKAFQNSKFSTGNPAQDKMLKNMQLDKLFTMGDTQVASYFLSTSSDIIHIYDEIDSVCGYFYQLEEANLITRDNVLRAEQVNEDISMNVDFPGVTDDVSSYVSIVKKALTYQNISVKIRDHVVPKAIKYGTYYIMIIPYSEIGPKLMALNGTHGMGYGGYPFYESTDTHALFSDEGDGSDYNSCMEGVTALFESLNPNTENDGKELSEDVQKTIETIKNNAKNIFVCEDDSVPDFEGLGTHKSLNKSIQNAINAAMKKAEKELDPNNPTTKSDIRMSMYVNGESLADYCGSSSITDFTKLVQEEKPDVGSIADNETLNDLADKASKKRETTKNSASAVTTMLGSDGITPDQMKASEDMIGCHIKLVDPRQLIPIKIFDYTVGYYYFENYDYAKMGTSVSDIMSNQMNFNQRSMVIDGIVDSVLKNLEYGDILKGDKQLRSMVLNCILYAEKRDNPIRIKFVRPDYIIPWKTNLDEHDNGQPVMLRSLLYARLYTSLVLFYTTAIITKSTDSEFYYLKESALDGQINNQISDMMDQLEDSNVDPIQIANGNILHGNRAINKRYFINMGTSEIKPFEMDVVSGQQIDLHNDFITDLKKMAIGATGVPAVMVDYVDEIEYATMLGMANIKHLTRCNGIKRDFNEPLTITAKTIVRHCYPNAIPDNILDKMKISLRESKVINNNMTSQQLNDNAGVCESMVKYWVGGDNTNPPEITAFIIEDMTRQLLIERTPSAPWELLPDMQNKAIMKARQANLFNKIQQKRESESGEEESDSGSE